MLREDEILLKAQELAKKAEISKEYFPKSTAIAIAIDAATWADETLIEKAYNWVLKNTQDELFYKIASIEEFSERFRLAMKNGG